MSKKCVFCKIYTKEFHTNIILSNNLAFAIKDISPKAPHHYLIIPNEHVESVHEISDGESTMYVAMLDLVKQLVYKHQLENSGYRLVINSGPDAGQEVDHLHMHLLAGTRL